MPAHQAARATTVLSRRGNPGPLRAVPADCGHVGVGVAERGEPDEPGIGQGFEEILLARGEGTDDQVGPVGSFRVAMCSRSDPRKLAA